MDRFDAMRVFTRVVERRSFTLAAEDLGLPRSTVTDAVKQLEARLGVRLLQRTTRIAQCAPLRAASRRGKLAREPDRMIPQRQRIGIPTSIAYWGRDWACPDFVER
jgi:DNA-binding transcriptional LysR family regulator